MFLLWHPSLTAINLSYTFPILETSATALCGTTGKVSPFAPTDGFSNLDVRWKMYLQSIRLGGFCGFQGEEPSTLPEYRRKPGKLSCIWQLLSVIQKEVHVQHCNHQPLFSTIQYHWMCFDCHPDIMASWAKQVETGSSQSPFAVLPQVPLILLGGLALGYHNSCAAMVGDMDRLVTQWILTAPKQCIEVMVVTSNPCLIYTTCLKWAQFIQHFFLKILRSLDTWGVVATFGPWLEESAGKMKSVVHFYEVHGAKKIKCLHRIT